MPDPSLRDDPVWREALDWLMRCHAAPDDAALRRELRAWLVRDARHAAVFHRAEAVWRLTGEAAGKHRGPKDRRASAAGGWVGRTANRRVAVGALAASGLIALLPAVRRHLEADLRTGVGEVDATSLPDGSRVHLDAGSAMAIHFDGAERGVTLLEGRAFFEVMPNHARPFTVAAGAVKVRVTGTAFDVGIGAGSVAVAVASGGVAVEVGAGTGLAARSQAVRLGSGDQLTMNRATGAVRIDRVAVDAVAAWRSGKLVVNGATVAEIVETLRRYSTSLILLLDDGLAVRRVTGVFDPRQPAAALRAAVTPYAGVVEEPLPYVITVSGP